LKALFTLAHLSPLGERVVPATDFYKAKDKAHFLHGGCPELVRIQRRISRKRYLGSKYIYEYERISLPIPRKFHNKVKPFLKQDLNMNISIKGSYLVITLTPAKTFLFTAQQLKNTAEIARDIIEEAKYVDSAFYFSQFLPSIHFIQPREKSLRSELTLRRTWGSRYH
jgi:hypothetical protein